MLKSYWGCTVKLGNCCKKHWQKYQVHKNSVPNWTSVIPISSLDMKLFHIIAIDCRNKKFSTFIFAFIQNM